MSEPAFSMPPAVAKGGVFAIGNFDGVHRGHRVLIRTAREKAGGLAVPVRVLTFEPHPRTLLKPDLSPFRLTPAKVKERLLIDLGVQDVITLPFTKEFSQIPAVDFVEQVLVDTYGAQHIVAGFDFVFGQGRGGNMKSLREWLAPHNVGVTEVTPFRDAHGDVMSSTRTRAALQAGDIKSAEHILGRPWSISGVIQKGDQRGRSLSITTANISLGEYLRPKFGVYAVNAGPVSALGAQAPKHQGVANIGVRPTVDGKNEYLEFHLFDFDADIYGQEWEVELVDFIRPEQTFGSLEDLKRQILTDIQTAKARLSAIIR